MTILWALVIVFLPAAILFLCRSFPVLDKIGAVVLCYLSGLLIGNINVLPETFTPVQNALLTFTVPLALPLLFFSLDMRRWSRLAGRSLLSFALAVVAVLIAATVAFLVFRDYSGPESWKVSGMLIGCYTGGSPNLAAIGTALNVEPGVFIAVNVADFIVPPLYLLLAMTFLQRILLRVLPPFEARDATRGTSDEESMNFTSYEGILTRRVAVPLMGAFLLSAVIFAAGGGLSMSVPGEYSGTVAILTIATLGVICSFIPKIRGIKMSFHLGQYFILIFSVALSTFADLGKLMTSAPIFLAYVAVTVAVAVLLHVLMARFFKIDVDTVIITSIAGVFSPPFVPMVAAALRNKEMIATGVITGIIGWVIGTYLGIGYAYFIRFAFGL